MAEGFITRKGGGGIDIAFANLPADPSNLDFVGNTNTIPGFGVKSLAVDNDFVYIIEQYGSNSVTKYHNGNLAFVGNTNSYGNAIFAMDIDSDFIYVGGDGDNNVKKYYKSNLAFVGNTNSYGSFINSIDVDNDFIYVAGNANNVKKYHKGNLAFVGNTPSYGSGFGLIGTVVDNDFIYANGFDDIEKYHKGNLAFITTSTSSTYIGGIDDIVVDDDFIYGVSSNNELAVKFHKGNLSNVGSIYQPSGEYSQPQTIDIDNDYIYVGGLAPDANGNLGVFKYHKGNLAFFSNTPPYGEGTGASIFDVVATTDFIYSGGSVVNYVQKNRNGVPEIENGIIIFEGNNYNKEIL